MRLRNLILLLLIAVILPSSAFGQYFGKNKVQYKNFKWFYMQSKHFDLYFYEGNEELAEFAIEIAENSYVQVRNSLKYDIKMRIPIIIYASHNDWQQNNVLGQYMEEGILGVTELSKNRVMVPYDGNNENFRHTVHHELLHAFVNDYIYGGNMASIISGKIRLQLPLWYNEGLAEYQAEGWSTYADMIIRDAVLNGLVGRTTPYKVGQSVMRYIDEKYGAEKIGELLGKIKITHDMEKGFRASLGVGIEKLQDDWEIYLKRRYWPEIANRESPDEIAKRLTDHTKLKNYYNISPAISPKGDKVAFISDKDNFFGVFILSTIDGKIIDKIISGQRNAVFEELHILSPGMSWSPDGERIAFSAKGGRTDFLYLVNVYTKKIEQKEFDLDGVFDASWSPDGDKIAFMGTKNGKSDLYVYDVKTDELIQVTNDYFTDQNPDWSPDGKTIVFASDREEHINKYKVNTFDEVDRNSIDYSDLDIYTVNFDGTDMKRITDHFTMQKEPIFSPDGKMIAFISDENGIDNLYFYELETEEYYAVTNSITGLSHLSWSVDGSKLVFSALHKGGYNIFMIKNPFKLKEKRLDLDDTYYMAELKNKKAMPAKTDVAVKTGEEVNEGRKYEKFIFDPNLRKQQETKGPKPNQDHLLSESDYKTPDGDYKINKYKLKFSTDVVMGNAGINTYYGLQGITAVQITDMLGDHRIQIMSNLYRDLKNSDYFLNYFYLPKKIDYGIGIANQVYHFYYPVILYDPVYGPLFTYSEMRLRKFGGTIYLMRPFSKYSRLEYILEASKISQDFTDPRINYTEFSMNATMNTLIYTKDNTLWEWTGPVEGERYSVDVSYSPKIGTDGLEFKMATFDFRKYFRFNRRYSFAFRISAGTSSGDVRSPFFLGGISNWFNRRFNGDKRIEIEDVFFSKFVTPLRGTNYYEMIGNRYGLVNLEFRFPMIEYLQWGWPLKLTLYDVKGSVFWDIGSAWSGHGLIWSEDDNFKGIENNRFKDIVSGYGFGTRINLNNMVLFRMDVAWKYDLHTSSKKPRYYFSMGYNY